MAIFETENHEIYADCHCGCDNGLRIRIEKDNFDEYCFCSYTSGNFYAMQSSFTTRLKTKLRKIWSIIRNKDFYYSEIIMSQEEFDKFRKALNKVDSNETVDK